MYNKLMSNLRYITIMCFSASLGLCAALFSWPYAQEVSSFAIEVFVRLLKFISLPMIFLSIVSAVGGLSCKDQFKSIFISTIKYTLGTTLCAASIAMLLYKFWPPATHPLITSTGPSEGVDIVRYLLNIVPSNIMQMFVESNVVSIVFSALILGLGCFALEEPHRTSVRNAFSGLFALLMTLANFLVRLIPYVLWAFVIQLIHNLQGGLEYANILHYLTLVICANILQAFVILPLFLKLKGLSPLCVARGVWSAIIMGFFSKSSGATMPTTMHCVQKNLNVRPEIARFTVPLCTTVNMNACAAFIYITVCYVAESHGVAFSWLDSVMWVGLATIAAVGNAGVPMGCFFMASAYLVSMGVPTHMMSVILPFYGLLDMLETAINIWSDACVVTVVNRGAAKADDAKA